jgi:MOSC domain-containing protein YiiM
LKNTTLLVGEALVQIIGPCQPRSRLKEVTGPAVMRQYAAMAA